MPIKEHILRAAQDMVDRDNDRDEMFKAIDDMIHGNYDFPDIDPEYQAGLYKVVSSDPHDSVRSTQRNLSATEPIFSIKTLIPDSDNRKTAEEMEEAIKWAYELASYRKMEGLTETINWEVSKYAMIAGQVMYLPYEIEARRAFGGDVGKLEYASMFGPFAVAIHNAKDVHYQYSEWGLERVLLKKVMPTIELIHLWGDKAKKVNKAHKKNNSEWATLFDLQEFGKRWVWAVLHAEKDMVRDVTENGIDIVAGEATGLNFIPWSIRISGNTSESDTSHQVIPMLKSVVDTKQWNAQCDLDSLIMTKVIKLHYRAGLLQEGGTEPAQIVGTAEEPVAMVPPGATLKPNPLEPYDIGMEQLADRVAARIDKSTVPRQLQTGAFPSGTPMGSVNIIAEMGLQTIAPYRVTAEKFIADIGWQMLAWIKAVGEPLELNGVGAGRQVIIDPAEYEMNNLFLRCKLQPREPLDVVARTNAARMMIEMGIPRSRAYEVMHISDTQRVQEEAKIEAVDGVVFEGELGKIQAGYESEIQVIVGQAQIKLSILAAQAEAGLQQQPQSLEQQSVEQQGMGGPGMDAGQGGTPPGPGMGPEGNREQVTGQTPDGTPL